MGRGEWGGESGEGRSVFRIFYIFWPFEANIKSNANIGIVSTGRKHILLFKITVYVLIIHDRKYI